MRRFVTALALSLIAAVTAQPQSTDQGTQQVSADKGERERPAAQVQNIADAPLRLSVQTKWATSDQQMLEVYFTVTNIGSRPVRAYSVRVSHGAEVQEGADVSSIT